MPAAHAAAAASATAGAELRNPLDVEAANTEIRRRTCSESHRGQVGSASLMVRSRSNRCPQLPHSYSYSGIGGYGEDPTIGRWIAMRRHGDRDPHALGCTLSRRISDTRRTCDAVRAHRP